MSDPQKQNPFAVLSIFAGCGIVTVGLWRIFHPLGYLCVGALLIVIGINSLRRVPR